MTGRSLSPLGSRLVSALTSQLLAAARRRPWLREQAGRAVDAVVAASAVPPPALRPGTWARHLGRATDDLPVIVVDCTGLDAGRLARLVDALPQVSQQSGGVRFVLVVAGAHLAAGRREGLVVEHVVDAAAWVRRHDLAEWPGYRRMRFEQIRRAYRPHQIVSSEAGDPQLLQQVITGHGALAGWQRLASRVERVLDPPPRPPRA